MSDYKHKDGMGSLFPNKYKEKENQPDHKGTFTDLDGTRVGDSWVEWYYPSW